jgi:hypothetical protein
MGAREIEHANDSPKQIWFCYVQRGKTRERKKKSLVNSV